MSSCSGRPKHRSEIARNASVPSPRRSRACSPRSINAYACCWRTPGTPDCTPTSTTPFVTRTTRSRRCLRRTSRIEPRGRTGFSGATVLKRERSRSSPSRRTRSPDSEPPNQAPHKPGQEGCGCGRRGPSRLPSRPDSEHSARAVLQTTPARNEHVHGPQVHG